MGPIAEKIAAFRRLRVWLAAENHFYAKLLGSSLLGILAIILLGMGVVTLAVRDHNLDSLRLRTLDIIRACTKVENDLANVEAAHRAFLLTGHEADLQPLGPARKASDRQLRQLAELTSGQNALQDRAIAAGEIVNRWVTTVVQPQIELRRAGATDVSEAAIQQINADGLGHSPLDKIRRLLGEIEEAAQETLTARSNDQNISGNSFQILVSTPRIESTVSEMKKAVWGYLLTGSDRCYAAYRQAAVDFNSYYGYLTVLVGDDSASQKAMLAQIKTDTDQWQREVAIPLLAAKQAGRSVSPLAESAAGTHLLNQVFASIDHFERSESERFDRITFQSRLGRIGKVAGLAGLCVLAVGVLIASSVYSFIAYSRHLRKIESAEAQTRSIIETTLDGVVTVDGQGVVLSMNPAAETMFQQTASAVVGRNLSVLIPQRLFVHDMANLGRGRLMAVGQRQNYYPFPIEISLNELSSGFHKTYVALIRDVSERKRSEETLRNIGLGVTASTGEEFIRSLVKQLSKALQTDFAFIVQLTRKGAQLVTALTLAEQGHIRNRNDYPLGDTAFEDVLKRGYRAFPKDVREQFPSDPILNELGAQSFIAMPLTDHKGVTVGVMGVIDRKEMGDMMIAESTLRIFAARAGAELERKRFEEDLAAEKERLAVTLRSIGDGVITIDVEGRIVLLNSVAERLTGWRQGQAQGQALTSVFHLINERTRQPLTGAIERFVETGAPVGLEGGSIIVAVDGTERLIESSASEIRDRNNRRIGVVLVFRDVTEKTKIEEERRKAEKLESLGVAAGGIAHDFNNLLTAIIGNLSLALISIRPEETIADRLNSAKKASIRAQELAQQLLTFAKGGAPIKKTASIGQLIQDTVSFSLRGTNIRSEFDLAADLWAADIDPAQISQAIGNMTMNAIQAMPGGGTVYLSCSNSELGEEQAALAGIQPGRYVQITMKDEGIGIPEAHLKKIFDPYFTTKTKGSGLGLATAYSIVAQHEGHIRAESAPGQGSTFTLLLPASAKQAPVEHRPQSSAAQPQKRTGKILVLDDEEDICALVTHALTPAGFTVTETNDPATAIRTYQEALNSGEKFDAVISDLTIPGSMGGQEAVKRLKEIDPDVRAIVSSGYAMDPVMSDYQSYGFCACIAKPYEISALAKLVREVVGGARDLTIIHEFEHAVAEPV